MGPKADYTTAIEQDPFRGEENHSAVGQHQASMYDKRAGGDPNLAESPRRVSNSINRRPSMVGGQCPFSAQRQGRES